MIGQLLTSLYAGTTLETINLLTLIVLPALILSAFIAADVRVRYAFLIGACLFMAYTGLGQFFALPLDSPDRVAANVDRSLWVSIKLLPVSLVVAGLMALPFVILRRLGDDGTDTAQGGD